MAAAASGPPDEGGAEPSRADQRGMALRPGDFEIGPLAASGTVKESDPTGVFEVECNAGTAGCESEAAARCGRRGYRTLATQKARGPLGVTYYSITAACGASSRPAASLCQCPPLATDLDVDRTMPAFEASELGEWRGSRLEATAAKGDGKVEADPLDRFSAPTADDLAACEARARRGDAEAQRTLGGWYGKGDGVARNPTKAIEWYQQAAEQGDAIAQNNLALFFDQGESVPRNQRKAVHWYRASAEHGLPVGQYNLGLMYYLGLGVPKDFEEASTWFRKAAAQGQTDAQAIVGTMYLRGEGVAKDEVLAYAWLNLAAAQGKSSAGQLRDSIRLGSPEVSEAQRASSNWKKGQLLKRPPSKEAARPR